MKENKPYFMHGKRYRVCTISELAENFDEWMIDEKAIGFTVGKRGKKIHWFITPSSYGFYYAYPNEDNGLLGWRKQLEVNHQIFIHYEK